MADWDEPLSAEERDALIEKIAQQVSRRHMETPAILFLEMHKPVSFLAGQGLVVLSPFIAPFVGFNNTQMAARLFEERGNVERLIRRIEELAVDRDRARRIDNTNPPSPDPPKGSTNAARE